MSYKANVHVERIMSRTSNIWSRRQFLAASTGMVPGLGLLVGANGASEAKRLEGPRGERHRTGAAELPPRVVALRTLGGDFRFDPVGLLIEPGTSVIWLNMGDFHTTTAFHPDNDELLPGGVPLRIPEGAESWHSGILGLTAGTQFDHRFQVEGVYDYFCQPHYNFGMVGRIIVGGPRGGPAIRRPLSELPAPARGQMPSVETVTKPAGRSFEWMARLNGVLYLLANGTDAGAAAARVMQELQEDMALRQVLHRAGTRAELEAAVGRFARSVAGGADYESLVSQADAAKRLLEDARRVAE